MLTHVANSLTLVRLWWIISANIRRHLSDKVLIDSLNLQFGIVRDGEIGRASCRERVLQVV